MVAPYVHCARYLIVRYFSINTRAHLSINAVGLNYNNHFGSVLYIIFVHRLLYRTFCSYNFNIIKNNENEELWLKFVVRTFLMD